jgi:hypothetical protein
MPAENKKAQPRHHPHNGAKLLLKQISEQLDEVLKAQAILLRRTHNIEHQTKAILVGIAKIQEFIENIDGGNLTPELETAVRQVASTAIAIDEQVPDTNNE